MRPSRPSSEAPALSLQGTAGGAVPSVASNHSTKHGSQRWVKRAWPTKRLINSPWPFELSSVELRVAAKP